MFCEMTYRFVTLILNVNSFKNKQIMRQFNRNRAIVPDSDFGTRKWNMYQTLLNDGSVHILVPTVSTISAVLP